MRIFGSDPDLTSGPVNVRKSYSVSKNNPASSPPLVLSPVAFENKGQYRVKEPVVKKLPHLCRELAFKTLCIVLNVGDTSPMLQIGKGLDWQVKCLTVVVN